MVARLRIAVAAACFAALMLAAPSAYATFPGANGKIAFDRFSTSPTDAFDVAIFTMNPDGSAQTNASNTNSFDAAPAWSPDGTKIAFGRTSARSSEPSNEISPGIYTMNADGTRQTQLTTGPDGGPAWSPDGSKIVFARCFFIVCQIYTMNGDGSGLTSITFGSTYDIGPDWSPDSTRIAFTRCVVGTVSHGSFGFLSCQIYTMNAVGADQTNVSNSSALDSSASWSPDATKIAFTRSENNVRQIYSMFADGTNQTRLSKDASVSDDTPVWSPDGAKIGFARVGQVYAMSVDGSAPTNLSNSATFDNAPDWQALPGPQRSDYKNAAKFCKAESNFLGDAAFRKKYGTSKNGKNAFGKCVRANR